MCAPPARGRAMINTKTDRELVSLRPVAGDSPVHLYVHGEHDRHVSRRVREEGVWEPYETKVLLSLLGPGSVFLDVGANIGYFSLLAAGCVGPSGAVVAVEPDPDNCRLLRDSVVHNGFGPSVELVEGALSDVNGEGRLYLSEDNLGDHQIFGDAAGRNSVPITLYNGSQLLATKLRRIDVLKVDTQGAEYQVMNGLAPLLRSLPSMPYIMIELTPYSLAEAGSCGRQLVQLLADLCPAMCIIDHVEHRLVECPAEELATWCDNVAATPGDQGFMNILAGPAVPELAP